MSAITCAIVTFLGAGKEFEPVFLAFAKGTALICNVPLNSLNSKPPAAISITSPSANECGAEKRIIIPLPSVP